MLIPARTATCIPLPRHRRARRAGKPFLADPILEPIHFGFTQLDRALSRRAAALARCRDPDGDRQPHGTHRRRQTGITVLLLGMCLGTAIRNVLVVQVSAHYRRTLEEHDLARRIMYGHATSSAAARLRPRVPGLHEAPAVSSTRPRRSRRMRRAVKDANFRIESPRTASTSTTATPSRRAGGRSALYPQARRRGDGGSCLLSRRRTGPGRDRLAAGQALRAGRAARLGLLRRPPAEDETAFKEAGHTLIAKKKREAS